MRALRGAAVLLAICALLPSAALADRVQAIAPLYQEDYTTVLFTYGGEEKSVASSGCAAVCMAMALAYFYPEDAPLTPENLLMMAYLYGYYENDGLSMATIRTMLEEQRLEVECLGNDASAVRRALYQGKLIIAYMGPGYFTSAGHYILIYGTHNSNRVWVIDPASRKRSETHYTLESLFREAGNGHAFMVCGLPEKE